MVEKMGEGRVNPELQIRKFEVVPARKIMGAKSCLVINKGVVLTVFEIAREAGLNEAIVRSRGEGLDLYVVQFPGCPQRRLSYADIQVKLQTSGLSVI